MSRMRSAIVAATLAGLLLLSTVTMASAYSTEIPLGYSFYRMHTQVAVVLEKLEISDRAMGSISTTIPQDRVEWNRLWYTYVNEGDTADQGYLLVEFIDSQGNVWPEPDGTYTGDNVAAHSRSSQRFLEIPVSKGTRIVKIKVIQGFDSQYFDVPEPGAATATPTAAATATPTATAAPTSQATATPQATGTSNCLPLLPFAVLTALGMAGYAGKMAMKK